MKISSWNVNGIRSAYSKGLMDWLLEENSDIICFQEIKADYEDVPIKLRNAKDYLTYWFPAKKKGYAGTAVLTKEEPEKVIYGIGVKEFDDEGRIIQLKFKNFTLINAYFPHGRRDKSKLGFKLRMYKAIMDKVKETKTSLIIIGDFNIARTEMDLANPKNNKNNIMFTEEERNTLAEFLNIGFTDTYRSLNPATKKFTWWPFAFSARERNIGWRIDYALISNDLKDELKSAEIHSETIGSDHCPISITL